MTWTISVCDARRLFDRKGIAGQAGRVDEQILRGKHACVGRMHVAAAGGAPSALLAVARHADAPP